MIPTVSTLENIPEVAITCSNELNENGVKTMKEESENVTNVKEDDEVYVTISKDCMLNMKQELNSECLE